MKKYSIAFLLIFTALITFAQENKNYHIGILIDHQSVKIEPLLVSLKQEIQAVVGVDATIDFPEDLILNNNFNLSKAEANYKTLLSKHADIIIAFGAINNSFISKLTVFEKPTILFGAVNIDFNDFILDQQTSGIPNFTYLVTSKSFKKDLNTLVELTNFSTVGIAIEAELVDAMPFKTLLDKEATDLGIQYKMIPYTNGSDITSALNSDIDAFYLASGFYLNENDIKQIADKLIAEKIPSFTTTSINDVANGLMATHQTDENINQFFRRIALSVEAIINGDKLSNLPIYISSDDELTINHNTAELVGMPIKYSLIANTNFVGDFVNVLSEKKYNLIDVMKTVVGENLNLQSSRKSVSLSKQNVKTAKSTYLPSVVANANGSYVDPDLAVVSNGQNPEYATSGNITLKQTLFSQAANTNIAIQKELLKAQEESYNTDELDAISNAASVYFNVLILKANLQIQNQNLNLTKKNLEISTQNYEAGQSGKSDVLRFTSQKAQNTQALVEASNQLRQAYFTLNQLLNNPTDFEIDVDDAELGEGIFKAYNYQQFRDVLDNPKLRKPFVAYLVEIAKKNAPEIKSLNYNLKANEHNLKLNSWGRFLPTLALQGQYNNSFNQWGVGSVDPILDDNYNVGVNLSIPIINQNKNNINKQIAKIQKDQLTINRGNIELNIATNVNTAILDLINEIANIEISKVSEAAAKESLELTQTAYSNGAVNIVQLLDYQNNYLSAQLAKVTAVYNYLQRSIQLQRYISYYFLLHTPEENQAFIEDFYNFMQNNN